jgi:peptidoglycan/LPS O-acetylase OafA/YrhL
MTQGPAITHFKYLDGIRGTAALWVMVGHIWAKYNRDIAVISWTSLAVDVFILVSGFLMVRQVTASVPVLEDILDKKIF